MVEEMYYYPHEDANIRADWDTFHYFDKYIDSELFHNMSVYTN